ncbi:hypothetical protein Klosneuvirus_1_110 [Klosneuvirus KNV1]|uniref:Endonuclease n=1 Tax=Klosneuvirus KNV1 TaxID=1977640 RepID=A0A1V0SHR7_9VIRU|nr:hypothetical protein Klosneuvirus_1_110 [Klosneuvirus KNV1]
MLDPILKQNLRAKIKKCEHGRRRSRCKDCRGKSICEHGRRQIACKDCGGSQICKHNKFKSTCKECDGSGVCEHDKIRSYCKDCVGGGICDHDRVRTQCKDCNGSSFCIHSRKKIVCKDCNGNAICEHNKIKYACKDCNGSQICKHDIVRITCIKCNGSQICEHKKRRSICKECNGGSICGHGLRRQQCRICGPQLHPDNWCKLCKYVDTTKSQYKPYCFNCYCALNPNVEIKRQFKLKEHHLRDSLKEYYPDIKMIFDKKIDEGCSLRRPDVRIECLTHTIIIECDENKHNGYSCENKRTMEIFQDLGNRPIVFLRFNPDSYKDKKGNTIQGCFKKTSTMDNSLQKLEWERRIKILKMRIDYYLNIIPIKEVSIEQLFYE